MENNIRFFVRVKKHFFLVDLKYENIPKDAKSKVKLCFLDYLAVYNRGLKTENSKIALSTILSLYPNELDMLNRGLISGIASHSLDLDDGHRLAHLHPGTVVFSTVLAIVCDDILKGSGLNVTTKEGSVSLTPASGASGQQMQTDSAHENEPEQDKMATAITDVQAEDESEG